MIDITKIDDEIRYLDFEPKKKFGGEWWLTTLVLALYILGSVLLLVGAALQEKGWNQHVTDADPTSFLQVSRDWCLKKT